MMTVFLLDYGKTGKSGSKRKSGAGSKQQLFSPRTGRLNADKNLPVNAVFL